ncbi:hypothetical protein B0T14DRAFT_564243 [Immersiella caudata]|uniref:Uncharacterized protein n=1 Tax=Immersiella caudata TaxID=314043 RepID=A0AA39WWB2_9PEZI|nr:hypothetical protein B0T14DRAFT_564243 [Immersiella caudata]
MFPSAKTASTSLISLSQSSRWFRTLIQPSRENFVRRLLALELLPEESPEWRANKHACLSCMKLRNHMCFDNGSILSLRMRKPLPGSREAARLEETDWQSFNRGERQKRERKRAAQERQSLNMEREGYHFYCNAGYRLTDAFENQALLAELRISGTERYKRTCIECKLARSSLQTAVFKSREVPFTDALERHFPGLGDFLHEHTPETGLALLSRPLLLIESERQDRTHMPCLLYTAFCGACQRWYKLAGFLPGFPRGVLD